MHGHVNVNFVTLTCFNMHFKRFSIFFFLLKSKNARIWFVHKAALLNLATKLRNCLST